MNAGDKVRLETFRKGQQKLWAAEIELEKTLSIFQIAQDIQVNADLTLYEQKKSTKRRGVFAGVG